MKSSFRYEKIGVEWFEVAGTADFVGVNAGTEGLNPLEKNENGEDSSFEAAVEGTEKLLTVTDSGVKCDGWKTGASTLNGAPLLALEWV